MLLVIKKLMVYKKNGLPDRRYRSSKTLEVKEHLFWQKWGWLVGAVIMGFLAGSILTKTLYDYTHQTLLQPLSKPMTFEVVKVAKAKESSETKAQRMFNITYHHESSWGTNTNPKALHNYCKSIGKWNGIGYSPRTKFCFNSEEEGRLFMEYYVSHNCSTKSLTNCLCYWNTGKDIETCAYSEGDLANAN